MPTPCLHTSPQVLTLVAACVLCAAAQANDMSAAARKEIDQLLLRVGNSGCEFFRSGTWHNAADAQTHLDRKLRYMVTRGMVSTPEDFIAKGATGSSLTGEAYSIRCRNGASQPSATWLDAELRAMRHPAAAASQPRR